MASLLIMGSAEVGSGVREELVITGSLGAAEIISGEEARSVFLSLRSCFRWHEQLGQ